MSSPGEQSGQPFATRGRDICFVDVETTGLDPGIHEIVEIGAVRVNSDLIIKRTFSAKVRPERIEDADPVALKVNGYNEKDWEGAADLDEAMTWLTPYLRSAFIAGHVVNFDVSFLIHGFEKSGMEFPEADYHLIDTAPMAWPLVAIGKIKSMRLDDICEALGFERGSVHRALGDAYISLDVARAFKDMAQYIPTEHWINRAT